LNCACRMNHQKIGGPGRAASPQRRKSPKTKLPVAAPAPGCPATLSGVRPVQQSIGSGPAHEPRQRHRQQQGGRGPRCCEKAVWRHLGGAGPAAPLPGAGASWQRSQDTAGRSRRLRNVTQKDRLCLPQVGHPQATGSEHAVPCLPVRRQHPFFRMPLAIPRSQRRKWFPE
jgi:hypothetical protein